MSAKFDTCFNCELKQDLSCSDNSLQETYLLWGSGCIFTPRDILKIPQDL